MPLDPLQAKSIFLAALERPTSERGAYLDAAHALAADIAKNPPLGVRSTIRARRWYMGQLSREVLMQVNLAKLHLTEDFAESARAFAEKRKPGFLACKFGAKASAVFSAWSLSFVGEIGFDFAINPGGNIDDAIDDLRAAREIVFFPDGVGF